MDMKPYWPEGTDMTDLEWFYSNTRQVEDCLCWISPKTGEVVNGYGQVWIRGHRTVATRWIWEQTNGPIAPGLLVCHHCDNPPCVKLDHLFLGTPRDNALDMVAKRRQGGHTRVAYMLPMDIVASWENPPKKRRTWK